MSEYRWTCSACSKANEAGLSACSGCGCPAGANGDTVSRYKNPESYKLEKSKRKFNKVTAVLVFIPFWILAYLLSGDHIFGLLLLATIISTFAQNKQIIEHIWQNRWGRNTVSAYAIAMVLMVVSRLVFFENASDFVIGMYVLFVAVVTFSSYMYLFKSKNGVELFNSYYTKRANKL